MENASSLFERAPMDGLKFLIVSFPFGGKLLGFFGIPVLKPKETKFFYDVVQETLRMRREAKNGQKRNDLVRFKFIINKTS
jgi:hypothetical protein